MKPADLPSAALAAVRFVGVDIDGTLTDGAMYYGPGGEELKRFHTRDGVGIRMLLEAGIVVAFVTGEQTPIVGARAAKLGVSLVRVGVDDKLECVRAILDEHRISPSEALFIGDDLGDLAAFDACGVAIAVADAVDEVRERADAVCATPGGYGAVREVTDAIIRARAAAAAAAGPRPRS